ncbi:WXG100 family type VII secretion target [Kitasatospora phosalacinea]|uniref:WXG100 family type VII secretion target n=1 Tax=Kitasatospora phosalacinea TaxID=2065 RepID=UPI0005252A92|nr:hypothetical protein [Kitasatospora phosalacinea]
MADETVWIDLDEVEAAAKKILGLLDELNGPANKLAAKVKQVQESVYGTDLVGKAIQGGSSSVGGLAQHQQQVLEGIQALIQNATAVGENLRTMAARHRANDEQQATGLGGITDTGAMPSDPQLAGLRIASAGTTAGTPVYGAPDYETSVSTGTAYGTPAETVAGTPAYRVRGQAEAVAGTPAYRVQGRVETAEATPEYLVRGRTETVEATPEHEGRRLLETEAARPAHPVVPASPPPIEGLGDLDPDSDYQATEAPTLDYNTPPPIYMGPGMWGPAI